MDEFSFAQKQRLAYIDFKLYFTGIVTRSEIVSHFELGLAAATRDLKFYKENAPENMVYDNVEKKYFLTTQFKPIFKHDARRTLIKLANNISDGFDAIADTSFPIESPNPLNVPDINIIATLSQSIINNKPISIIYTSLSSGSGARELVPHSIVDNGLRWHLRAFALDFKYLESLSPDPILDPYNEDYKWLAQVYESVKPASDNIGKLLWLALGSQTMQLIHDNIHVGEVHNLEEFVLDADVIENIFNNPDPRKIKQLEKGLIASIDLVKELCKRAVQNC